MTGGARAYGGSSPVISKSPSAVRDEHRGEGGGKVAEIFRFPRIPSTVEGINYARVISAALYAATPGMSHNSRCTHLAPVFGSPDTVDRLIRGRTQRVQADHVFAALALAQQAGFDTTSIPGVREVIRAITGVQI